MTNGICHCVIAISRIFLKDQWKFLPWWLLSKSEYNEYLLYGRGLKNGNFFQRSKIFFNAKYQREFTQVTSEASFLSKFKLILALLKDFAKLKKVHFESLFHTTCSFLQHFFAL